MSKKQADPTEILERYSDFRPTGFDSRGLRADSMGHDGGARGDWFVVPVTRTRDSGPLADSNFERTAAALQAANDPEDSYEVHRFGHWGPGWFEIIIVRPDSKAAQEAAEIACALSDYPVLDEEDFSRREWEAAQETWSYMGLRDRVEAFHRASKYDRERANVFSVRAEEMPSWAFEACRPE